MGNSKPVISNQGDVHENLLQLLKRREGRPYCRASTLLLREDKEQMLHGFYRFQRRLIFDTGCGTGESTVSLARRNPETFVVGIDKSEFRLSKARSREAIGELPNLHFVRARLEDLWQFAVEEDMFPLQHYFLYPNPWPKKKHLRRRWHAHPCFPIALKLGGSICLRTNWKIYALEFLESVRFLTGVEPEIKEIFPSIPLTAFEKKYKQSGHTLYQLLVNLPSYQEQRESKGVTYG